MTVGPPLSLDGQARCGVYVSATGTSKMPPVSDPIARPRRLRPARLTRLVDIGANPINPAPYDALLALAAKDSEALKHLALLADAVFDSPDLTLRILQILAARSDVAPDVAADYVQMLG